MSLDNSPSLSDSEAASSVQVRTDYIWGIRDIKAAREMLRVKYPHAHCDEATVLCMITDLVAAFRYDKVRIDQVIREHFEEMKKKGKLQF
jgi:DNA polymerase II small subunit/DNA polymerase delta subunit B